MRTEESKPGSTYISQIPKGYFEAKEDIHAPLVKPERSWRATVTLAEIGFYAAWFGPIQVLLGLQAAFIAPSDKELVLSLVTGFGAFVSMVSNPFFGALSDHTTSRYGRRAPWVLGGTLIGVFGLVFLAASWSVWAMVFSWALVQAGVNAAFAALSATLNDRIVVERRGEMSGWMAAGQNLGALAGTGVAVAAGGIVIGYVACITLLCVSVIPYLWRSRDRYVSHRDESYRMTKFLSRFWISPRNYPDFFWAWFVRLMVLTPFGIITLYLLYYLMDVVHHPNPQYGVLILSGIFTGLTVVISVMAGLISDYQGKRKPLIIVSGVLMAVSALILAFFHSWEAALVSSIFLGVGHGCFIPVHFALTTQVLPPSDDTGRDLGIFNIAAALPQVISPILAMTSLGLVSNHDTGYSILFGVCAAWFVLGAVAILRVKSVK